MVQLSDTLLLVCDPIYGIVEVEDKVLVTLMCSATMDRLKRVFQYGITALMNMTAPVTRYEHSVGAMILVRKAGGSIKEQVAALLHDVAHTALSHVVDLAFPDQESFHELYKEEFLRKTEIPGILEAHGLSLEQVLHEEDFPLLEQPAPKLCADRLDYGLRDAMAFGHLSQADAQAVAASTIAFPSGTSPDRILVCQDISKANIVARAYMRSDSEVYTDPVQGLYYQYAAMAIKRALAIGYITRDDLWLTDRIFWEKLSKCWDTVVRSFVKKVHTPFTVREVENGAAENVVAFVPFKVRTLNPDVCVAGVVCPLTEVDAEYASQLCSYKVSRLQTKYFQIQPFPAPQPALPRPCPAAVSQHQLIKLFPASASRLSSTTSSSSSSSSTSSASSSTSSIHQLSNFCYLLALVSLSLAFLLHFRIWSF